MPSAFRLVWSDSDSCTTKTRGQDIGSAAEIRQRSLEVARVNGERPFHERPQTAPTEDQKNAREPCSLPYADKFEKPSSPTPRSNFQKPSLPRESPKPTEARTAPLFRPTSKRRENRSAGRKTQVRVAAHNISTSGKRT